MGRSEFRAGFYALVLAGGAELTPFKRGGPIVTHKRVWPQVRFFPSSGPAMRWNPLENQRASFLIDLPGDFSRLDTDREGCEPGKSLYYIC